LSETSIEKLPEAFPELFSLTRLNLDDWKRLQKIRGIPSYLKHLSALNCESLGSSCRKMQLNQVLFFLVFNFMFHSTLSV
jgi:hypothetical protein